MERVSPIVITDNRTQKEYILEFTRNTVRKSEQDGFSVSKVQDTPFSACYDLFYYAFLAHTPMIKKEYTDSLLDEIGGVNGVGENFWNRLSELYTAPFNTLKGESDDHPNVTIRF